MVKECGGREIGAMAKERKCSERQQDQENKHKHKVVAQRKESHAAKQCSFKDLPL